MQKTVSYLTEIVPGTSPLANVSVSNQGAVTAISSGNNFLNLDAGTGSYNLQNTDNNARVYGNGLFFIQLPDTTSCYVGQQFHIWSELDDTNDYQTKYAQIQSNDGTVITKLNYKNASATFTVLVVGDNSSTGWSCPFVQDYIARVTINNAATFAGGNTIVWDTVEYNTEKNNTGLFLFDPADNGMHIFEHGWYEFTVKFYCEPGNNNIGLLLSRDGNKTNVTNEKNGSGDPMTLGFTTTELCATGQVWDVRVSNNSIDSLAGQQWFYQFICRRIRN